MSTRITLIISSAVTVGLAVFAALFGVLIIYESEPTAAAWIFFYSLVTGAVIFLLVTFSSNKIRQISLIIFVSSILGLYFTDIYFLFSSRLQTQVSVVKKLRGEGIQAFSAKIGPGVFAAMDTALLPRINGIPKLPVSGIANAFIVLCNETGRKWITYKSDELGYNNPKNIWNKKPLQIVLVGDSFTHGNCVNQDETVAGQLRKIEPATVSAGYGGNGPLLILASLVESVAALRPKHVFWLHYSGNDILDAVREYRNPILRRYLEKGFSQNLGKYRNEIDKAIRSYHEDYLSRPHKTLSFLESVIEVAALRNTRRIFNLSFKKNYKNLKGTPKGFKITRLALERAKRLVDGWGGKLHFVYLPSIQELIENDPEMKKTRDKSLRIAKDLNIPTIDITKVFSSVSDPEDLFTCKSCHYNALGYFLISKAIAEHLE